MATTTAQGAAFNYTERTDTGVYTTRVAGLAGATAANYTLRDAGAASTLTITPKLLTLTGDRQTFIATYGSSGTLGTLGGRAVR